MKDYANNFAVLFGGGAAIVLFTFGHWIGGVAMVLLTAGCLWPHP